MAKRLRNLTNQEQSITIRRPNIVYAKVAQPLRFLLLSDVEFGSINPPLVAGIWEVEHDITDGITAPPAVEAPPGTKTTDDIPEGKFNTYFTGGRAREAVVKDTILDDVMDTSPSQNAVFEALTSKVDSAQNVGTSGAEVFKAKQNQALLFRKILAGSNVNITQSGDNIHISANAGEVNTSANSSLGTGTGSVFKQKLGVEFIFRKLKEGTGVTITTQNDDVTISSDTLISDVNLTASQVNALNTNPVVLVSAPGSTDAVVVESTEMLYNFASAPFSGAGDLIVKYNTGGTLMGFSGSGFIDQAADQRRFKFGMQDTLEQNKAVVLTATSTFTGGGSSALKVRVKYKKIKPLT